MVEPARKYFPVRWMVTVTDVAPNQRQTMPLLLIRVLTSPGGNRVEFVPGEEMTSGKPAIRLRGFGYYPAKNFTFKKAKQNKISSVSGDI